MLTLLISIHRIESDVQGLSMLRRGNLPGIPIQLLAGMFSFPWL